MLFKSFHSIVFYIYHRVTMSNVAFLLFI